MYVVSAFRRTVMKSGYSLAEVIRIVKTIDMHAIENHHALSVIYETLLEQTADAGWSGEFYTPRSVVRLYSADGGRASATVRAGFDATSVTTVDLLERPLTGTDALSSDTPAELPFTLHPFQIITLRYAR